jgi:type I restriction enzyme, R subunit
MTPRSNEATAVQRPLTNYAVDAGWQLVDQEQALYLRRGEQGLVFHDVLVQQLQRLNPGVVDLQRAEDVISRFTRVAPTIAGNMDAWEFLNGLKTIFVDEENRERNVRLLDPENPGTNTFHVTEEFIYYNGIHRTRPDVVFLINGIPVIVVETKKANHLEGIAEALEQIRRYHRESPELMSVLQLHALTHLVQYYYGVTWNLSRKGLFNWRDEQAGDFETLAKTFMAPRRVLRVLTEFILFTRKDDELAKVVLRPHQMQAVERAVLRAADTQRKRGLVWHTQGSGKTYTMITLAKRLVEDPKFKNPTVLMLIDRNELQEQLFRNLSEVGFDNAVVTNSKKHLRQLLHDDRRGLIVTMIHKFDEMPADLNTRDNVYVLVDEAHRTTGGDLGNYLVGALPNATLIGFTGTPIDKTSYGKGTFKVFGADDPTGYLDKYSISQSIKDGTTVPLHYQLAPNELRVDEETLEREFLDLADSEGVSDVEELNRVLERAVTLGNMLKNPERVDQVAQFVAKHYQETIKPMGYKAFLVGVDRWACAKYKEALDNYLPASYSTMVYSAGHNDPPGLAKYHLSEEDENAVRKAFRDPQREPKILIVTEKLLTGFDAPILYGMYLDKPMRDHVLLQAIARVNRPYEDDNGRRKPAGFVLDFVGIFTKLEQALAFDSQDVQGVVEGIDVLKGRFTDLMKVGVDKYLPITDIQGSDDKRVESALEHFRDEEARHNFYHFYRELSEIYEILSPDPFLRPYLEDYERITWIYGVVRAAFEPGISIDKSFLRKTAELVQKHTTTDGIADPGAIYEIGEQTLDAIIASDKPDTTKVFNLLKKLHQMVEDEGAKQPHLIAIGERAEQIAEAFKSRQMSTQEALEKIIELVRQHEDAEETRDRHGFTAEGQGVYWLLQHQGAEQKESVRVAKETSDAFEHYPHWRTSRDQEQKVRIKIYKSLHKAGMSTEQMKTTTKHLMDVLRRALS